MKLTFEEHNGTDPLPKEWILSATWGSQGGVRYRHKSFAWNDRSRVYLAKDEGGDIVGMHVWLPYTWGFLRHMILVPSAHQGKGIAKALMASGKTHFEQQLEPGQVIAGIVDQSHSLSMHLGLGAGYQVLRQFDLITFARRFPKHSTQVRRATQAELDQPIRAAVRELGRDWSDFSEQATPSNTWVFKDTSGLRAGATVVEHHLHLLSLGDTWSDQAILRLMPAFIRKAHPKDYRPISLHYCWGDVTTFDTLWEALLSEMDTGAATIGFDTEDPMYEQIKQQVDLGHMGRAVGPVPWAVTGTGSLPRPLAWPAENR